MNELENIVQLLSEQNKILTLLVQATLMNGVNIDKVDSISPNVRYRKNLFGIKSLDELAKLNDQISSVKINNDGSDQSIDKKEPKNG